MAPSIQGGTFICFYVLHFILPPNFNDFMHYLFIYLFIPLCYHKGINMIICFDYPLGFKSFILFFTLELNIEMNSKCLKHYKYATFRILVYIIIVI